ncbi:MAG: InlB B-repeat-containing protein [Lachnospiraceae bacterium]|nr:InlB B-repeat-containing protein [Lachnospiraceae bacterium]
MKCFSRITAGLLSVLLVSQFVFPAALVQTRAAQTMQPGLISEEEEADLEEDIHTEAEPAEGTVTLTLDANGGCFSDDSTNTEDKIIASAGSEVWLTTPTAPIANHKIFKGWSDTQDGEVMVKAGSSYLMPDTDKKLYAVWADAFIVRFISEEAFQDCIFGNDEKQSVRYSQDSTTDDKGRFWYTQLSYLVEDGYPLGMWTTNNRDGDKLLTGWKKKDGESAFIYSVPNTYSESVTEDMELYPVWEDGYQVTFSATGGGKFYNLNSHGGSLDVGFWIPIDSDAVIDENYNGTSTYVTDLINKNGKILLPGYEFIIPPSPEKAFLGWSPDASGSQLLTPGDLVDITQNTKFYAIFGDGIPVTFDANGGTISGKATMTKAFAPSAENVSLYNYESPSWADGSKIFCGWTKIKDDLSTLVWDMTPRDGMVLYAYWADKATIHVKADNGSFTTQEGDEVSEIELVVPAGLQMFLSMNCSNPGNFFWLLHWSNGNYTIPSITGPAGKIPDGFRIGTADGEYSDAPVISNGQTYYLNWVDGCKITLDPNGGSYTDTDSFSYGNSVEKFNYLQKKGVTYESLGLTWDYDYSNLMEAPDEDQRFGGWTTVKDDWSTRVGSSQKLKYLTDDITLYAYWIKVSKVHFDANGGFFENDEDETTYDCDVTEGDRIDNYFPGTPAIIDDNKIFIGWSLTADGEVLEEADLTADGNEVTLFAVWGTAYTVEFRAQGGYFPNNLTSYTVKASPNRKLGDYDVSIYTPATDDAAKIFNGWNLYRKSDGQPIDENPFGHWDFVDEYPITESIIAVPNWAAAIIVTFDAGEKGYFSDWVYDEKTGNKKEVSVQSRSYKVKKESSLNECDWEEPKASSGNYVFDGWSLDTNGTGVDLGDYYPGKNITVYARWRAAATIKLHTSPIEGHDTGWNIDGEFEDECIQKGAIGGTIYEWLDKPGLNKRRISKKDLKKLMTQFRFRGWALKPGGAVLDEDTVISGDMELYAIWGERTSVTFHANGGTLRSYRYNNNRQYIYGDGYLYENGEETTETYFIGDPLISEEAWYADRANYGFAGWATSSDNNASVIDESTYRVGNDEEQELFAAWTKDYYTLTLVLGNYNSDVETIFVESEEGEVTVGDKKGFYIYKPYPAPQGKQTLKIRLKKNAAVGGYLDDCAEANFVWDENSFDCGGEVIIDQNDNRTVMPFKGFSTAKTGAMLVNPDTVVLDKDLTLYAVYEQPMTAEEEEKQKPDTTVTQTQAETEKKADTLVSNAATTTVKKNLADIMPVTDSDVMVNAINEVKDQTVIDSLKEVLVSVMESVKEQKATVEAVQLFDLDAKGSGKVGIYVGKEYFGQIAVVGHYHGGEWTTQQCKVDINGYITPSFKSFSPIAISILSKTVSEPVVLKGKDENENKPAPSKQEDNKNNNNNSNVPSSVKTPVTIEKTDISKLTITLSKEKFTYTGKTQKPDVTVKTASGAVLKVGTDYDVTAADGKDVGTYTVKVTGKGNYTGAKELTFEVIPKNAGSLKLKAKGKKITVTWKKQAKQTNGYEIQYADNKNFKKAKKVTVKKAKTQSATLKKGLKKGKKYYVRIRSYKTVKGKKIYSDWSKVKSVKIKK